MVVSLTRSRETTRMDEKKWTLLLLGHDPGGVRQFTLSRRAVRHAVVGLSVLSLLIVCLSVVLLVSGGSTLRAHHLAAENAQLTVQLQQFRERLNGLEETMERLSDEDGRVRVLAGLDAVDEEVMAAGIGGPGLATPEANPLWTSDSVLGKAAFAVDYDLSALERRATILAASLSEASDTLAAHMDLLEATPSILPAAGVLSSRFSASRMHPISHRALPHEGIDISAALGTPILAAAKGTVTFAGWKSGLGYTVEIDHGYGYLTRYGHASKILVRRGQRVTRGQVIANVGSTGLSTSPHLHYEVRVGGQAMNPLNYILGAVLP